MSRQWSAYHPEGCLEPGQTIRLGPDESHHLTRVLRSREGDELRVFDGRGGSWRGRVDSVEGRRVRVKIGEALVENVESPVRIVLVQGVGRPDRMDWVVQKATEVGVQRIVLVPTERSEPLRGRHRIERWARIAVEACKQSGRAVVPGVELAEAWPQGPGAGIGLLLHSGPAVPPLGACLDREPPEEVRLAVGPEGGLTEAEVGQAMELGWHPVRLGPRILRTETAGLVAASIVLSRWGDLGGG